MIALMLIKETETEYHVPKEKSDDKKVTIKKDVTSKTQTYQQAILDIWKQVWNIV